MNTRHATTHPRKKPVMRTTTHPHVLPVAGALIAAGLAGFLFGAANAAPAVPATPAGPVAPISVNLVYEESGEVRSIELTDADGHHAPVGSVGEEWPRLAVDYSAETGADR